MSSEFYRFKSHATPEILEEYSILDTPPESMFDDLTSMASTICDTPMAILSLVDQNRVWFKSKVGIAQTEVPADAALCTFAMHHEDIFVVADAKTDPRFSQNPMVTGSPGIRFYAAAPLVSAEGIPLGTLCVMDLMPRELGADQIQSLRLLARQASYLLELRRFGDQAEVPASTPAPSILFDFAPTPLMVCRRSPLTVIEANLAAANLYGFERDEIVGMQLRDLFLSDGEFGLNEGEFPTFAFQKRKNGEAVNVKIALRRIFYCGEPAYLLSIEEQESAARLTQPQRIELPMVCHELRQPLTAIHSSLGYLIGIGSQDFPNEWRKILEIAYRNTLRMLRLVNDLQETSSLSLGITRIVSEDLNFGDVVQEAIDLSQPAAIQAETKILLVGTLSDAIVSADHDRLIQVFSNLFSNALRFSPSGKPVTVSMSVADGNFEVRVKDQGPGIPASIAKQLFEGMVNGERRKAKKGSGLGLYICKLIMEAMGGSIRFETTDFGTTFIVSLPAK
jgi:signal transduction histidine kinase